MAKRTTSTPKAPAAAGGNTPQTITTDLPLPRYHQVYAWCAANADFCRRTRTEALAEVISKTVGYPVSVAEVARIRTAQGLACYTAEERIALLEQQVARLTSALAQQGNSQQTLDTLQKTLRKQRERELIGAPYPVPYLPPPVLPAPAFPPYMDPSTRPMCRLVGDGSGNFFMVGPGPVSITSAGTTGG